MKASDIALLVIAIVLVPIGGVLACVDSALARVSVARIDELVREGRRGAENAERLGHRSRSLHQLAAAPADDMRDHIDRPRHARRAVGVRSRLARRAAHDRGHGGRQLCVRGRRPADAGSPAPLPGRAVARRSRPRPRPGLRPARVLADPLRQCGDSGPGFPRRTVLVLVGGRAARARRRCRTGRSRRARRARDDPIRLRA